MLDLNVLRQKGINGIGRERTELDGTGLAYTDVLGKDQRNKNYIMKLVSVSIIQENSCFEHTRYVTMGIVLVVLELQAVKMGLS